MKPLSIECPNLTCIINQSWPGCAAWISAPLESFLSWIKKKSKKKKKKIIKFSLIFFLPFCLIIFLWNLVANRSDNFLNPPMILIRLQNLMEFFKNSNKNFKGKSIRWLEFISLLTKIIKELCSCLTWWVALRDSNELSLVALKICLIFLACLQCKYPMQNFLKVYELFLWNHNFFFIWPTSGIY